MTINANANANARTLAASNETHRAARVVVQTRDIAAANAVARIVLDDARAVLDAATGADNGDDVAVTMSNRDADAVAFTFANGVTLRARFVPCCGAFALAEDATDDDGEIVERAIFNGAIREALDEDDLCALEFIYARRATLAATLADIDERRFVAAAFAAGVAQRFAQVAGYAAEEAEALAFDADDSDVFYAGERDAALATVQRADDVWREARALAGGAEADHI